MRFRIHTRGCRTEDMIASLWMLAWMVLVSIVISSEPVAGQGGAGDLDSTFGTAGKVTTDFFGEPSGASAMAIQADGKIVVAGTAGKVVVGAEGVIDRISVVALARYNSDGSLDTLFGSDGKVMEEWGSIRSGINAIAIQSHGYIVVAGFAEGVSDGSDGSVPGAMISSAVLARYNSDGTLDQNFGTGGKVAEASEFTARAIAVQSDRKIVVAGRVNDSDVGDTLLRLARYNEHGSLDLSFGTGGMVRTDVLGVCQEFVALAIQPDDGKIVAAGNGTCVSPTWIVARYNDDGTLDSDFGTDGIVITEFPGPGNLSTSIALQPDGQIVVAGATDPNSVSDFALARYNYNGSLDTSFDSDGKVTTDFLTLSTLAGSSERLHGVAIQSDGKIIAVGSVQGIDADGVWLSPNFALARYNSDGTLDAAFGTGGRRTTDFGNYAEAYAIAIQPDDKILAAGAGYGVTLSDFAVARYTSAGSASDTTPPDVTVPADITVAATSAAGAVASFAVTATDAVTASPTVDCAPASGSKFAIGATTVSCTASDAAGNTSVAKTFSVTVLGASGQVSNLATLLAGVGGGSFSSELNNVQRAIAAGQEKAARGSLNAFANHVKAQSGKQLPSAQASQLLADIARIAALIGY